MSSNPPEPDYVCQYCHDYGCEYCSGVWPSEDQVINWNEANEYLNEDE